MAWVRNAAPSSLSGHVSTMVSRASCRSASLPWVQLATDKQTWYSSQEEHSIQNILYNEVHLRFLFKKRTPNYWKWLFVYYFHSARRHIWPLMYQKHHSNESNNDKSILAAKGRLDLANLGLRCVHLAKSIPGAAEFLVGTHHSWVHFQSLNPGNVSYTPKPMWYCHKAL